MPKYIAKTNLTVNTGGRGDAKEVLKGQEFEISKDYAEKHLVGLVDEVAGKAKAEEKEEDEKPKAKGKK